jgi:ABC-type Fe3+-hydroxamate transport system substrate-binding protein
MTGFCGSFFMPSILLFLILAMVLQQTADLNYIPQRIVSLVPSLTELLFDLGLEAETVGITKFCVHPSGWLKTKERIGGTKTVNIDKVHQLQPDLIIANKEENVKEQIEELANDYPVWLTDVNNMQDALQMMADIGTLTGKSAVANILITNINKAFDEMPKMEKPVKTAYLIWREPYMTVGSNTFIHEMLLQSGLENVFADKTRYPQINIEDLPIAHCQLLLLSSEPYPFKQNHIDELSHQLPGTKIILADGEFFSWYGSRLLQSPAYFKQLITQIQGW